MNDGEKDWHACAVAAARQCFKLAQADQVEEARSYRRRALAASLHHAGEGWQTIRARLVPDLSDGEMLWLSRWTC